jgi:hypothetical protein
LERVASYLEEMVADKDFVERTMIEGVQDIKGFEGSLRKALDASGRTDGVRFLVIPNTEPWTGDWVEVARAQLARRRSTRATNRVLFVGDPRDAWDWLDIGRGQGGGMVNTLSLSPWSEPFVLQWAIDAGFGPLGKEDLASWGEATGWWGGLLAPLGKRLKGDPAAWKRAFDSYQQQLPEILRELLSRVSSDTRN